MCDEDIDANIVSGDSGTGRGGGGIPSEDESDVLEHSNTSSSHSSNDAKSGKEP